MINNSIGAKRRETIERLLAIPTPARTDGRGFRAWEARRANKFALAVSNLIDGRSSIDERRLDAQEVSDYIVMNAGGQDALQLPDTVASLPRGYQVTKNRVGERSLSIDSCLLNPSFAEPLASEAAIERLTRDLKTGWIAEIATFFEGE